METWYLTIALISAGTEPANLGPMSEQACKQAVERSNLALPMPFSISCRQAIASRVCNVDGPFYGVCPVFDGSMVRMGH
jgi:hypothetical protein